MGQPRGGSEPRGSHGRERARTWASSSPLRLLRFSPSNLCTKGSNKAGEAAAPVLLGLRMRKPLAAGQGARASGDGFSM